MKYCRHVCVCMYVYMYSDIKIMNRENIPPSSMHPQEFCVKITSKIYDAITGIGTNYHPEARRARIPHHAQQ